MTYLKGLVRYHKEDVVMTQTGINEWKATVVKSDTYNHLQEVTYWK